jgi:hypothetical protein
MPRRVSLPLFYPFYLSSVHLCSYCTSLRAMSDKLIYTIRQPSPMVSRRLLPENSPLFSGSTLALPPLLFEKLRAMLKPVRLQ